MLGIGLGLGRDKFTTESCPIPIVDTASIDSSGGLNIGDTLIGNFTTVSPYTTVEYRWKRLGITISTTANHTITAADVGENVTLQVRIRNSCGNWSAIVISSSVVPRLLWGEDTSVVWGTASELSWG